MQIDPRHLVQLSFIVETGSFQAAADQLGVTQPALSRNILTLETKLGSPLFNREGRRSIPNALGTRLARNGLAIRMAQEEANIVAGHSASGSIGELRIGAPPIVAGRFLSTPLATFIKENPDCRIEIKTGLVHELQSMLVRGQVDLVIGPQVLAEQNEGLEFRHLADDRVGILCRTGHSLTKRRTIVPNDLQDQVWLAHSRGSFLRQQTEAAMVASGLSSVRIGCETDSIRTALETVAATDLITTMPRATTAPYLEDKLTFLNYDHPQFQRPLGVISRAENLKQPVAKGFIRMIRGFNKIDVSS